MSLIGSVFERKPAGSPSTKPLPPSNSGKTGFPPVQHRSKSAFARGREEARKNNFATTRQAAPPPIVPKKPEKSDRQDWREQISRENEARVESMTEAERQEEIQEIIQRFGSGVGDILRKAREARERKARSTVPTTQDGGLDKMEEVPLTSPTFEERKSFKRVGSPPPALSTSLTRPNSRAENRRLRFAELTPEDVHVYESAPPSPRKKAPLLLLPPPDTWDTADKPISLGTWKGSNTRTEQLPAPDAAADSDADTVAAKLLEEPPPKLQPTPIPHNKPESVPKVHQSKDLAQKKNDEPEEGTPEYIRRRYFPHIPPNDPSLAWIEESSSPSSSSNPSLRFDLTGTPIPPTQSASLPTHLGLHHHAEGSRAGYTLDDIFLLTRSTVPAQRTVMLGVLAGIARWLGRNVRKSNEGDASAYQRLEVDDLKGKEEDLRKRILAAGVGALSERGSPGARAVEVIWECIVGWEGETLNNLNIISSVELEDARPSASNSSGEKTKSAISTLPLEYLLPQIADAFALGALPQEALNLLLGIIYRLARENNTIADSIVATPKLLANIVQKFLLSSIPSGDSSADTAIGPQPLALEILITLASASRTNATVIVEPADALLRFITILPPASPLDSSLATTLLSLTIQLYKILASYGLYANIATTTASHFSDLHRHIISSKSTELYKGYLNLIEAWIVCATDPHRTTPEHDILWSQVVGWGWTGDILEFRGVLDITEETFGAWTALWNAEAAWLEGSKVNALRGGMAEREAAVIAMRDGFESGKEQSVVSLALGIVDKGLAGCVDPARLEVVYDAAAALSAALRLWTACSPTASEGPLEAPHLLLPFPSLSELSAKLVTHTLWSWILDENLARQYPYLLAYYRPLTGFLFAFLQVSRRLPGVSEDLWVAQAFSILRRLVPGDEENALNVMRDLACQLSHEFLSFMGWSIPDVIWERGGLSILQPFLAYMLRPNKDRYIAPLCMTPQSISLATTQRQPSALTALSIRGKDLGLPLPRDWTMSPLDHLLHSGESPVFKNLPPSWDASEAEIVRASLLLARVQREILVRYRLGGFVMTREEVVFACMKVFMLEHGQPHNDAADEVFRDEVVGRLMDDLLNPYTLSAALTRAVICDSQNTGAEKQDDLEKVAARFLGASTPFYQYYTDFVGLYDAISFSHPIFSRLLLPPTSMRYPADYRKHLWSDYGHILKNIRIPIKQVICESLAEYLWPVESDPQMIGVYLRALAKGQLEGSEFLRKVAVHHVSSNIWGDPAELTRREGRGGRVSVEDERSVKLLKAVVVQGGIDVTRDVVLYCTKEDGVTTEITEEVRKKRVGDLERWRDVMLSERVRGLLET